MKLVHEKTAEVINIGDKVTTFRGEKGTLMSVQEPRHSGSTGRVGVKLKGTKYLSLFYPSVIDAKWSE